MSTENDIEVWYKRWNSLDSRIDELVQRLSNGENPLPDFPRKVTMCHILQNLRSFGGSHFTYFYQGFLSGTPNLSEGQDQFPPPVVLRSIVDQIAFDLDVLLRAINQRLLYGSTNKIIEALDKADRLAVLALQPAVKSGLIDEGTTVLTYFQKSPSVRVIPYAKVAIIGIPFTALDVSRDYLAIPHEVAHYIFRHGALDNKSISTLLNKKFKGENAYIRNWIEEIFADIYGTLIAGPAITVDFQDLQLDDPLKEFAKATIDFEDPVPIVRPDIYTKVLAFANKGDWGRLAPLLNDRWFVRREKYWAGYKKHHLNKSNANESGAESAAHPPSFTTINNTIILDEVRKDGPDISDGKPLDEIIYGMLREQEKEKEEGVLNKVVTHIQNGYVEWAENTAEIEGEADLELLYQRFDQFFKEKLKKANAEGDENILGRTGPIVYIPELSCDDPENLLEPDPELAAKGLTISKLWIDYVKKWSKRNEYVEIKEENKVEELLGTAENARPPKTDGRTQKWGWSELASGNGWATRGPEPNPMGGGGDFD